MTTWKTDKQFIKTTVHTNFATLVQNDDNMVINLVTRSLLQTWNKFGSSAWMKSYIASQQQISCEVTGSQFPNYILDCEPPSPFVLWSISYKYQQKRIIHAYTETKWILGFNNQKNVKIKTLALEIDLFMFDPKVTESFVTRFSPRGRPSTFSVARRRIFETLNWYGCPNIEPKSFRTRFVKRLSTKPGSEF